MVKTVLELGADPNVITSGRWTEVDSNQYLAFNDGEVAIQLVTFMATVRKSKTVLQMSTNCLSVVKRPSFLV